MTTHEMMMALTKKELEFLQDNPEWIDSSVEFFVNGGWSQYSNDEIAFLYNRDIKEEV